MLEALHVRNWEPGDEYRRTGPQESRKDKIVISVSIASYCGSGRRWPVLEIHGEIIWARRFGVAAKFQATGESHDVIRVVYQNG